jgi:hypothetical protein
VAGVGAFLVIVGAATFVAVRWDQIPDSAKLAALVAVTVGCLGAHRRLRSSLPATAAVLLHLGVLLTPVDVAAVGAGQGWGWPALLLAVGAATAAVPSAARRADRSVVLRVAGGSGVVLLAGGVGAVAGLPSGPVLAAAALGAALVPRLGREPEAVGWALVAALAMPLATARTRDLAAFDVLVDLGLAGPVAPLAAAATGLLAGATLALVGRRRDDVVLALAGVAAVVTGAAVAWQRSGGDDHGPQDAALTYAAVAALALLVEVAAWAWRSDPFWSQVARPVAVVGEACVAVVTVRLAGAVVDPAGLAEPDPAGALAAALATLTWATAVIRRPRAWAPGTHPPPGPGAAGSSEPVGRLGPDDGAGPVGGAGPVDAARPAGRFGRVEPAGPVDAVRPVGRFGPVDTAEAPAWPVEPVDAAGPVAAAVAAASAVALATTSAPATGVALGAACATVLLAGPARALARLGTRASGVVAALLLAAAPLVAGGSGDGSAAGAALACVAAALGIAGALATAAAVVRMSRGPYLAPNQVGEAALPFALLSLAPVAAGAGVLAGDAGTGPALTVAALGLWGVAAVLDRVPDGPGQPVGLVPRLALAVPLALAPAAGAGAAAGIGALVAALLLLDTVRLDEPTLLVGAGCATPVMVGALGVLAGFGVAGAGVAVTVSGLAWLGAGRLLPRRSAGPAVVNAVLAAAGGLALSLEDQRQAATSLLLIGGTALLGGLLVARPGLAATGAGLAVAGLWSHLGAAGVTVLEAYALPVAATALLAGWAARRDGAVSSWLAYAPAFGLLGGAGLAERLAGGAGWHAVLAGGTGAVAVVLGGMHRLIGPLLVGTGLVVAVSAHETLGVTAQVPTWLWLCSGGVALLGAGVGMERRGLGPVDAGRRVVDVVRTRYS